jgi:glycosyltransferase involved in cell wall biosynthesis
MTTYNTEKYVLTAIKSILNQTYRNLELIIIDDASTDSTVTKILELNDPRITLYHNKINCGTYYSKNFGILHARGEFIALQDSDDYSDLSRLEKQMLFLKNNPKIKYVKCHYVRVDSQGNHLGKPRIAFQSTLFRKEVFNTIGYYDSVRVAADDEFDARAKLMMGNGDGILEELVYFNLERHDSLTNQIKIGSDIRLEYVNKYKQWHKSIKSKRSKAFITYPLINRPFTAPKEITIDFNSQLFTDINVTKKFRNAEKITATIATIPDRLDTLVMTINSILPQVDELRIYLNDFPKIPPFLIHPKIKLQQSDISGSLADNGKFFWEDIEGYHFPLDDDILYPHNYVEVMINMIKKYHYSSIIGVHGIIINQNSRTVYIFSEKLDADKFVNILGTGTMAYHTSTFRLDLHRVNEKGMIDIFVGIQAMEKKVPLIAIERPENWLADLNVNNL